MTFGAFFLGFAGDVLGIPTTPMDFIGSAIGTVGGLANSGQRTGGFSIYTRLNDTATPALREFNRDLNRMVSEMAAEAARDIVLPAAKSNAPHRTGRLRSSLIVRRTVKAPYLTTTLRGRDRRRVGLLEFGGTVETVLRPKRAKAIQVAPGVFRAAVYTTRHYRAQAFMQRARDDKLYEFGVRVRDDLADNLQGRLAAAGYSAHR